MNILSGMKIKKRSKRNHESRSDPIISDLEEVEVADESETEQNDVDNTEISNAAWADSISKILRSNKPKKKKSLVLSKAKKLTDIPKTQLKPAGFEVETAEGDVKEEKIELNTEVAEKPLKKKVSYNCTHIIFSKYVDCRGENCPSFE